MEFVNRPPAAEEVLCTGTTDRSSARQAALRPDNFPQLLLWFAVFIFLFATVVCFGILFSFFTLFLIMIGGLPIALYLAGIIQAVNGKNDTEYWVTARGIYVRLGSESDGNPIRFYSYDEIRRVQCFNERNGCGDVRYDPVDAKVKFGIQTPDGTIMQALLRSIPDCRMTAKIINDQKKAFEQQKKQSPFYADSAQPFFGGTQGSAASPESAMHFLGDLDKKEGIPESLPDETVEELQAELFGTGAEQQGAYTDPTVYPLPELPEQAQEPDQRFMQGGL